MAGRHDILGLVTSVGTDDCCWHQHGMAWHVQGHRSPVRGRGAEMGLLLLGASLGDGETQVVPGQLAGKIAGGAQRR